jgi:lipid II:glycine glycyltransferase (peptidoglycan interpeptide bridge formation enzyme)
VSPAASASDWESFLTHHPEAHLLQSVPWADFKGEFGWRADRVLAGSSGAQVLFRPAPLGTSLAYVPKGPVGPWSRRLVSELDRLCASRRAFLLKVEPDAEARPEDADVMGALGFRPGSHTVQPRRTLVLDLRSEEDELLGRMHPKTRYNIGLAERRGVVVRAWTDLAAFVEMIHATAARQQFGAHAGRYYRRAYEIFHPRRECELFVAEHGGRPLAALMAFARSRRAWYFYGASTEEERPRMPTYALQWAAIRWARSRGCEQYDLWGVPDADLPELEAQFAQRSDGLWGVYRFKRGFGARLVRTSGAWDRPYSRLLYPAYRLLAGRVDA